MSGVGFMNLPPLVCWKQHGGRGQILVFYCRHGAETKKVGWKDFSSGGKIFYLPGKTGSIRSVRGKPADGLSSTQRERAGASAGSFFRRVRMQQILSFFVLPFSIHGVTLYWFLFP